MGTYAGVGTSQDTIIHYSVEKCWMDGVYAPSSCMIHVDRNLFKEHRSGMETECINPHNCPP